MGARLPLLVTAAFFAAVPASAWPQASPFRALDGEDPSSTERPASTPEPVPVPDPEPAQIGEPQAACRWLVAADWDCVAGVCEASEATGGRALSVGVVVNARRAACSDASVALDDVVAVDDEGAQWTAVTASPADSGWLFTDATRGGQTVGDAPFPPVTGDPSRSGIGSVSLGLAPTGPSQATGGDVVTTRAAALIASPQRALHLAAEASARGPGGTLALRDTDGRVLRLDVLADRGDPRALAVGNARFQSRRGTVRLWLDADRATRAARPVLAARAPRTLGDGGYVEGGLVLAGGPVNGSVTIADEGPDQRTRFDGDLSMHHRGPLAHAELRAASRNEVRREAPSAGGVAMDAEGGLTLRQGIASFRPALLFWSQSWTAPEDAEADGGGAGMTAHAEVALARRGVRFGLWTAGTPSLIEGTAQGPWREDAGHWALSSQLRVVAGVGADAHVLVEGTLRTDDVRAGAPAATAFASLRSGPGALDLAVRHVAEAGVGADVTARVTSEHVGWLAGAVFYPTRADAGLRATHGQTPIRRDESLTRFGRGVRSSLWASHGVARVAFGADIVGPDVLEAGGWAQVLASPIDADWGVQLDVFKTPRQQGSGAFVTLVLGAHPVLAPRSSATVTPR